MVIRLAFPPWMGTVHISPWYEKATSEPSVFNEGNLAKVEASTEQMVAAIAQQQKRIANFFMIM
jgi:hypothetical protein